MTHAATNRATPLAIAFSLATLTIPCFAGGSLVEVAQESMPGAGDFDANVLGYIRPIVSPMNVVDYYAYGATTYGGTYPLPQTDTSLLFLHQFVHQVSLVCVHDRAGTGTGRGDTRVAVDGHTIGVGWQVQDEPHGSGNPDDLYVPPGLMTSASEFTANQHWGQGGDGWAIGFLEGPWEVTVAFDSTIAGQQVASLCCWKAFSHDSTEITLALEDQRRVRLRAAFGNSFAECAGAGTPPPCGNAGVSRSGCANSSFVEGAELSAFGVASISADSLTLVTTRSIPSQPGLFFQGDLALNGGAGFVFGDGLRCAGVNVKRLETTASSPTGAASSSVPIAQTGGASAGDVKRYQYWYRDPNGSPCGSGFNLSNGFEIAWLP